MIFRRGKNIRLAINRRAAGEGEAFGSVNPRHLQNIPGGDGVLLQIHTRIVPATAHIGVGLKMKDEIAALAGGFQRGQIQGIAPDDPQLRRVLRHKLGSTGAKIIIYHHRRVTGQQRVYQMAADETRPAGDKNFLHFVK